MNIQTFSENRLINLVNALQLRLTPGQIIEGHILKLYPNNKAHIMLGTSQAMIAQLEASLNIGERYHFQVQANDGVLHLKVVGEPLTNQIKQNAESLLKHVGLKVSKPNIDLVQSLMNDRIPFDKNQLSKGFHLLNLAQHHSEAIQAVKQMITLQTPMTEPIFNAFYSKNTNQLTFLMKELSHLLNHESSSASAHQNLQNILEKMLETSPNYSLHKTENGSMRPIKEMSMNESIRYIQQLINNNEDVQRIKQEINRRIIPTLPEELQQRVLNEMQANTVGTRELLVALENLKMELQQSQLRASNVHSSKSIPLSGLKEQFMALMNDYLQFIGTTDENRLKENRQPLWSLKAYLLQTIQQSSDSMLKQRAQTLIHVLNGLQLQSISENQYFIQASLQVPGEKFSLNKDIFIDFESKKTADGKVDADHARVLFYLNLGTLKETVVDMQIQKRHVTIALYNDHKQIKQKAMLLQPLLEKRLKSLNYHLTTISVKPLEQRKQTNQQLLRTQSLYTQEGIDFRV